MSRVGLIVVAALMVLPGGATGQVAEPLTPQRAIELARLGNPLYRSALNSLDLAGPQARQAWGAFLPRLDVDAGTTGSFLRQLIGTDDFGNPIENPNATTRYNSGSSQGLSVQVPLFEGGARFHQLGQARAQADALRWTAEAELLRATTAVERDFFEAQRQQELVGIENELLGEAQRDSDATQRLFRLAARTRSDVLGGELAVQQQESAVWAAEAEQAKALLRLRATLGNPEERFTDVAPAALGIFDPAELDVAQLVAEAVQNNATVRSAEASERASEAASKSARARRWPSVALSGGLSRSAFGVDASSLFDLTPDDRSNGYLQLSVSIPLFQQFQTSFQIAQADVDRRNAAETTRQRRLETERDVRAALIDLVQAHQRVESTSRALEIADERLRLVREEYRLAGKSFEDLQAALRSAGQARRDVVDGRYGFVEARIALEEALGARIGAAGVGGSN